MINYLPFIGLEVHIELNTKSKMFCSCPNDPNERHPNVNICQICLGHPGVLPVINKEAVRKVIKTGLALDCQIPEYSRFDRKNYFYPDLPKGYQISQYNAPLCLSGYLEIPSLDENIVVQKSQIHWTRSKLPGGLHPKRKIRIRRVHLEEDTGKLLHPEGADYSLVDFNRAGMPLMELVTEPDLHSAKEARCLAEELRLILRCLDVSDADMEKGEMRVEANISLINHESYSRIFAKKLEIDSRVLGTKVEIKNLNSFRSLEKAIDYEIKRQTEILRAGKKVIQETRGWQAAKEITFSQREKEGSHDYRYFPEPDLPPLHLAVPDFLNKIKAEIPELPEARRKRLQKEYKLSLKEIEIFVSHKDLGEYFEKVVSELTNWLKEAEMKERVGEREFKKLVKLSSSYILTDLQGLLKGTSVTGQEFLITPENFAEFITLIYQGKISSKIAKSILKEMFEKGGDPSHLIEEKGLSLLTDELELEKIAKEIIARNQKAVEDFQKGKEAALQFLVGQIMRQTKGRAEPQKVQRFLKKLLT